MHHDDGDVADIDGSVNEANGNDHNVHWDPQDIIVNVAVGLLVLHFRGVFPPLDF